MRDLRFNLTNTVTVFLNWILILAFYYNFYRYPFKINSSQTSPYYSDTPIILQVLKYGIFGLIAFIFLLKVFLNKKNGLILYRKDFVLLPVLLYLTAMSFVDFGISKNSFVVQTGIFLIAPLLVMLNKKREIDFEKLSKTMNIFFILSILMEGIQLFLFWKFHRLPALAYENSLSVRFGSIWDDPNGFGVFISFLLPFVLVRYQKKKRRLFLALIALGMLLLTQSLTGIVAVLAAVFLGEIWLYLFTASKKKFYNVLKIIMVIGIAYFIFMKFVYPSFYFQQFLSIKSGSMGMHINIFDYLKTASFMKLLGFEPYGQYGEAGYVNMLLNFGIIYVIIYMLIGLNTIVKLTMIIKRNPKLPGKEIYHGALIFCIAYMLGLFNLPLDTVFPLNLLFAFCITIPICEPLKHQKIVEEHLETMVV